MVPTTDRERALAPGEVEDRFITIVGSSHFHAVTALVDDLRRLAPANSSSEISTPGHENGLAAAVCLLAVVSFESFMVRDLVHQGTHGQGEERSRRISEAEPTDLEVADLLASISRRITRLAKRRGINPDRPNEEIDSLDPLATDSPLLSGIRGASVSARVQGACRS
jgi:hypothetical protein